MSEALFRAKVINARVKKPDSIRRKADTLGIDPLRALDEFDDLVGVRIVCNNLEDVNRVVDAIEQHNEFNDIKIDPVEKLHHGTPGGYRGRHLIVKQSVVKGYEEENITAEIQVRTLLQDAWAHLSHDDFYKPDEGSPTRLNDQMKTLSDRLYNIDRQAESLRGAVENQYTELRSSLELAVETKVEQFGPRSAMESVIEALANSVRGHQLAGIEVFFS